MSLFGRKKKEEIFTDADLRMSVRLLAHPDTKHGTSADQILLLLGPQMRVDVLIGLENDGLLRRDNRGWWFVTNEGIAAAYRGRTS